jgi:hypothetical protein
MYSTVTSEDTSYAHFNTLSSAYKYEVAHASPHIQPASTVYFFYGAKTGISGDHTFTNRPGDLKKGRFAYEGVPSPESGSALSGPAR